MKLVDYIFAVQESLNNEVISNELKNLYLPKVKDAIYLQSDCSNLGVKYSDEEFWFELRYFSSDGNQQLYCFTITEDSINFKNNLTNEEYLDIEKDEYFNLCFSMDTKLLDYKDLEKIKSNALKFKNMLIFYAPGEETYHE